MKSGAIIQHDKLTQEQALSFQIELMNIQIALEDSMYELAKNTKAPAVVFMDRGLMDSKAYLGQELWEKLKLRTGWTSAGLRDNRYDAILHLVTAADGMPEFYGWDNEATFEDPEEAIALDKALRAAYLGHNKLFIIPSKEKFSEKIQDTLSSVQSVLGLPTERMRFRKFLIDTSMLKYDRKLYSKKPPIAFHMEVFGQTERMPSNNEMDD